jgi:clan AA aspartic protease (TIGR02281 family)
MRRAVDFASAIIVTAAATTALAAPESKCQLVLVAQWSTRSDHYRPVVDGEINGQKIGVLLDTGAGASMIHRSAARRLGLRTSPARGYRMWGIGGETQVEEAYIDEFKIGDASHKNWVALVSGEHEFPGDLALLLGYDFLHQMDVEFDLTQGAVRLFQPRGCEGASLAYWSKEAVALTLEGGRRIFVPVRVNGKPLSAEVDSGATISSLSLEAALQLGMTPKTEGVTVGSCSTGLGRVRVDKWIAPFESFAIGDELIRNPRIHFGDLWQHTRYESTGSHIARRLDNLADMLLGSDFLRAHRVLVAHSQGKLYFSYVGGTVFPATPGRPCNDARPQSAPGTTPPS